MTTVRGKAPLIVSSCPDVTAWTHSQKVIVQAGGFAGKVEFLVKGELSVNCAKNLIRELRKALRQIRDETRERLDKAVSDAEGPL